jgi:hypothetical protein
VAGGVDGATGLGRSDVADLKMNRFYVVGKRLLALGNVGRNASDNIVHSPAIWPIMD